MSFFVLALGLIFLFAISSYILLAAPGFVRWIRGISYKEHLSQLEKKGDAVREEFNSEHALTFEDLCTGCLVYFLDIGDKRVLCLHGQDYPNFEYMDDGSDENQKRCFPTRSFSILRHKTKGEILDLIPGNDVFEPVVCDDISNYNELSSSGLQLLDGKVFNDVNFDELVNKLKNIES